MTAGRDRSVGIVCRIHQAKELRWWCGTVSVDESNEVAVAAPEGLHQDAAFTQLRIAAHFNPTVYFGVARGDICRAIGAAIEGDHDVRVGIVHGRAVCPESAVDALLFVVCRDHNVKTHDRSLVEWALVRMSRAALNEADLADVHCCSLNCRFLETPNPLRRTAHRSTLFMISEDVDCLNPSREGFTSLKRRR
jgi:hypothetical protein